MITITNERYEALNAVLRKNEYNTGISIYTLSHAARKGQPKQFGVNWSAKGTCTAADTKKFAAELAHAADVAEKLNELEIKVVWVDDDPMIQSEEDFYNIVNGLEYALENNGLAYAVRTHLKYEAE